MRRLPVPPTAFDTCVSAAGTQAIRSVHVALTYTPQSPFDKAHSPNGWALVCDVFVRAHCKE